MKQTAVEWLENQIKTSKYFYKVMEDIQSRSTVAQSNIFEQAKKMERKQIIDFRYDIADDLACGKYRDKKAMEERYNEYLTFKQQKDTDVPL